MPNIHQDLKGRLLHGWFGCVTALMDGKKMGQPHFAE
jgi:hypothetical protein